jgi:hypothetical protein
MADTQLDRVTYPSDIACQIVEVLDIPDLIAMKKSMQNEHELLHEKAKRVAVLNEYIASDTCVKLKELLKARMADQSTRGLVYQTLNEPTFEAFKVLEVSGLPPDGSTVFSSTATANSGNDDAMTSALNILGCCEPDRGIRYQRSSTCTIAGKTAVSNQSPKNPPVFFTPDTPVSDWHRQSMDLALQFYRMSVGACEGDNPPVAHTFDRVYHWGCINQCFLQSPLGNKVSSWALHEKWNIVMTMAMMWHGVMTLKPGGQMCLKVRIFKRAETLALVSLISCLFDSVKMVDNPRQVCTFVSVVYSGMTKDNSLRDTVAKTLKLAMDQRAEHVFLNPIIVSHPKCAETMKLCEDHRCSMIEKRAKVNTIFLMGLYCLKDLIGYRVQEVTGDEVKAHLELYDGALRKYYGHRLAAVYMDMLRAAEDNMSQFTRRHVHKVLCSKWMRDNF